MLIAPPSKIDYGFYNGYVFKVTDTDLITALNQNFVAIKQLADSLTEDELNSRYDTGKWSIKEIFFHLVDSERNFGYRIMRISRGDQGMLPMFNIHDFIINANVTEKSITNIIKELELLRQATILSFQGMDQEMLDRTGPARDVMISVRALGFAIIGHAIHHMDIIREKYLYR